MSAKPPEILDKIVDKVLAYKPKPKSKGAKKRLRKLSTAKAQKSRSEKRAPT